MCDKPGPAPSHRFVPFAHSRLLRAFILTLCLLICQLRGLFVNPLDTLYQSPPLLVRDGVAGADSADGFRCVPVSSTCISLEQELAHAIGPHIRAGSVDERSLDRAWAQGNDSQAATAALGPESLPEREHERLGRSMGARQRGRLDGECPGHIEHGAATIQQPGANSRVSSVSATVFTHSCSDRYAVGSLAWSNPPRPANRDFWSPRAC